MSRQKDRIAAEAFLENMKIEHGFQSDEELLDYIKQVKHNNDVCRAIAAKFLGIDDEYITDEELPNILKLMIDMRDILRRLNVPRR